MQHTAVPQSPLYRVAVNVGLVAFWELTEGLAVSWDTARLLLVGLGETEGPFGVASPPPRKSETQDSLIVFVKNGGLYFTPTAGAVGAGRAGADISPRGAPEWPTLAIKIRPAWATPSTKGPLGATLACGPTGLTEATKVLVFRAVEVAKLGSGELAFTELPSPSLSLKSPEFMSPSGVEVYSLGGIFCFSAAVFLPRPLPRGV